MKDIFEQYIKLRSEIDTLVNKLECEHRTHMKCRAGCAACCMDYSIFPVEFYAIADQLGSKIQTLTTNAQNREECVFLKDRLCQIYDHRPIICRTHGLPLLYTNDEGEWELSACELNFTDFELDEFHSENTYPQDKFNSKLFLLNQRFIREFKDHSWTEFDLIPLRKLLNFSPQNNEQ